MDGKQTATAVQRLLEQSFADLNVSKQFQRCPVSAKADGECEGFEFSEQMEADGHEDCPSQMSTFQSTETISMCPFATRSFFSQKLAVRNTCRAANAPMQMKEAHSNRTLEEQKSDEALKSIARNMLESLVDDDVDGRLQSSRFMAYIRQLAGEQESDASILAAQQQDALGMNRNEVDDHWDGVEKGWTRFQAHGFGYEKYARQMYEYHQQIDASDDDDSVIGQLERQVDKSSMQWYQLGVEQQQNEMDGLAIAALYRSVDLDASNSAAWIALIASLLNEACIPDALDAFYGLLGSWKLAHLESLDGKEQIRDPAKFAALWDQLVEDREDKEKALATSLIYCMAKRFHEAIEALKDHYEGDFLIQQRIGALLANQGEYERAVQIYDQLLEQGHGSVRLWYNRGIAFLGMDRLGCAKTSFIAAMAMQKGSDEALMKRSCIWDVLAVCGELGGDPLLSALVQARDLVGIRSLHSMN